MELKCFGAISFSIELYRTLRKDCLSNLTLEKSWALRVDRGTVFSMPFSSRIAITPEGLVCNFWMLLVFRLNCWPLRMDWFLGVLSFELDSLKKATSFELKIESSWMLLLPWNFRIFFEAYSWRESLPSCGDIGDRILGLAFSRVSWIVFVILSISDALKLFNRFASWLLPCPVGVGIWICESFAYDVDGSIPSYRDILLIWFLLFLVTFASWFSDSERFLCCSIFDLFDLKLILSLR